ncbi:MAG: sigma-70 family RNA polymerase sigma factor [Phycisphaerae bacterium]
MITDAGQFNASTLPTLLLRRSARLNRYVSSKIPRTLTSRIAAEDILQEVWIAAHRRISHFRPHGPGAFDQWLFAIINNKLLDAIKTARRVRHGGTARWTDLDRHKQSSFLNVFGRAAACYRTPSSEFSSKEAIRAVRMAIDSLPDDRRRAIWLIDIDGFSVADVARKMHKTTTAVRGLLFHGRRQLRERVGNAASFFTDAASSETAPL